MEFALILRELWSRKWLLAVGVVVAVFAALLVTFHVSIIPPSLQSRSLSYASARTQVIVDSPVSSLGDLDRDVNPLVARAGVYARLLTSPGALDIIGRQADVDPRLIWAQGPYENNQTRESQEPTAEVRSNQIVSEADEYRLRFDASPELPLVTIYSQAPTVEAANRLADAAAQGLGVYVRQLQDQNKTPLSQRVNIRQLGQPFAKVVNDGVAKKLGALVFVFVFVLWCAGMLVVRRLVTNWRASGEIAAQREDDRLHPRPQADPEPYPATALVIAEHAGQHPVERQR